MATRQFCEDLFQLGGGFSQDLGHQVEPQAEAEEGTWDVFLHSEKSLLDLGSDSVTS